MIRILLEDGPCLAVDKPTGILTQGPPAAADALVPQVKAFLKARENKPGAVYLGVPHRLDRAVSGVVLFAKNSKAARRLAEQFRDRKVRKIYWALVENRPPETEASLRHWLAKIPDKPMARVCDEGSPDAKEALLRYRVLEESGDLSLVEVELTTGRFHQIRAQFAAIGCPVAGDFLYGARAPFGDAIAGEEPPIALHARRLEFYHPIRYDIVGVESPLPSYWQPFLGPVGRES